MNLLYPAVGLVVVVALGIGVVTRRAFEAFCVLMCMFFLALAFAGTVHLTSYRNTVAGAVLLLAGVLGCLGGLWILSRHVAFKQRG